ncbi:putative amidophosphoribosyltransferase [Arthrobacter stackebrandtii]|uniref:Amidophosphoribosyltransferase n=1 Tax=Arthrobacter stackebrandtii TaxID=272161 RepID=A0ABS4YY24_9MICC|nr:phosphoribosyltransferase family protein [Arthrobacter stackebrandtii]MBP2413710.1 putative amidophosphoribosyltransferase [Arthrobacter stackebrandtii]PYH00007.1 ComF family protein [Arthrobacter stackebrandtii]
MNTDTAAQAPSAPRPASHRGSPGPAWLRAWLGAESAWRDFLFLVMPSECVVCGREDHALCPECSAELRRETARPRRVDGSADALVGVAGETYLPVVAAGVYRDALSASILAFKNHGRTELAAPLGRCLARALDHVAGPPDRLRPQSLPPQVWLVPIPGTGSGWRRRGYDPVAMLLKAVRKEGRMPPQLAVAPVLGIRARAPWNRSHQKGLGRAERRSNVRNTMKIRHPGGRRFRLLANPCGQAVLLLDDVLTTGSTLREGAKTLANAGFDVRGAVVLAASRAPEGEAENGPLGRLAENSFRQKMNKSRQ